MPRTRIITRSRTNHNNSTDYQTTPHGHWSVYNSNGDGQRVASCRDVTKTHNNDRSSPAEPSSSGRWNDENTKNTKRSNVTTRVVGSPSDDRNVVNVNVDANISAIPSATSSTPPPKLSRSRRRRAKSKQGLSGGGASEPKSPGDNNNNNPKTFDFDIRDGDGKGGNHVYNSSQSTHILPSSDLIKEKQKRDFGFAKQIISNILKSQTNQKWICKPTVVKIDETVCRPTNTNTDGSGDQPTTPNTGTKGGNNNNNNDDNDDNNVLQGDIELSTNDENENRLALEEPSPEATVSVTKRKRRRPRRHSKRQVVAEALSDNLDDPDHHCQHHQIDGCCCTTSETGDSGLDVSSQCSSISGSSSAKGSNGDSPSRSSSGSRSSPNLLLSGIDPENIPFYFKEPDIEVYQNPFEEEGDGGDGGGGGCGDDDTDSICSWSEIEHFDDYEYGYRNDSIQSIEEEHGCGAYSGGSDGITVGTAGGDGAAGVNDDDASACVIREDGREDIGDASFEELDNGDNTSTTEVDIFTAETDDDDDDGDGGGDGDDDGCGDGDDDGCGDGDDDGCGDGDDDGCGDGDDDGCGVAPLTPNDESDVSDKDGVVHGVPYECLREEEMVECNDGDDDGDDGDGRLDDSEDKQEEEEEVEEEDPLVEIDYDKYLPSNILMHVKRDLVSILMEYGQTREVKVAFEEMDRTGPHHASRFFTSALVDGETFPVGCGSSKKNAKKAAAAFALKIMYERGKQNLRMVNESAFRKIGALNPKDPESRAHKVLLASRHALEVCQETQFINYSKEKIVATFVLELHGKMKVVALGTGNRCILYPNLTQDGNKIIHAHAEVIARRAFIRYLYKQLLLFNRGRNHPIFTKSDSGKLKLRDKIQVHLYISRPPCGDAAAFPTIGNHPNKMRAVRKQGQLRTIIDDGEGAIPTEFHVPPGPNGKERLRIMTCSDKICRWNALGMQGALLSHFIDPIYINTLVIGSHTGDQRGHLPRAISGRIKCGRLHEVIQRPYRINSPEIQYPHDDMCDIYTINKSKQYFITWSYGDEDTEVIDAITGVTNMEPLDPPEVSRVCKRSLHGLFLELCAKFGRTDLMAMDYCTAKRCATTFQRMKSFVGQHMAVMGFGHWYSLQETYGTDNFSSNNDDCPTSC